MVATILQQINNQPHHDVRKTKYDEHESWKETEVLMNFLVSHVTLDDLRRGIRDLQKSQKDI